MEAILFDAPVKKDIQAWFEDGNFAGLEAGDFFGVIVDAGDIIARLRKAGSCD